VERMVGVMKRVRRDEEWGGGFFDWEGKRVEW
jgi:hypothetical protein